MGLTTWLALHVAPALGYAHGVTAGILKHTEETGWVNPEMEILHNCYKKALDEAGLDNDKKSLVVSAWCSVVVILDQDSHYLMRLFYFLEKVFRHPSRTLCHGVYRPSPMAAKPGALLIPAVSPDHLLVHKVGKAPIFLALGVAKRLIRPKKYYKHWEAQIIYDAMTQVIELDEVLRVEKNDHLRNAFVVARNTVCRVIDDDKDIRRFTNILFKEIFSHEDMFRIQMHRKRPWWMWEQEYKMLCDREEKIRRGEKVEPDAPALIQNPEAYRKQALDELAVLRELKRSVDEKDGN